MNFWGREGDALLTLGGTVHEYRANLEQNRWEVLLHVFGAHTQEAVSLCLKNLLSLPVLLQLLAVDPSIYFHDQTAVRTTEVRHKRTDRMLTAKSYAVELTVPQGSPQERLARGRDLSKIPSRLRRLLSLWP